ncbi:MAG: hypothetical protein HY722_09850 [Planctomycetes bacterium]|nr:hypothetical protein [Planctomycetota bacterium]
MGRSMQVVTVALLATSGAAAEEIRLADVKVVAGESEAQATYIPWSGDWWNQDDAKLGFGWAGPERTYTYEERTDGTGAAAKKVYEFKRNDKCPEADLAPLAKYDLYVQRRYGKDPESALLELKGDPAKDFFHHVYGERREKFDKDGVSYSWWGHCNGWAAAGIMEREPLSDIIAKDVRFEVADLKGLLTESYFGVESSFTGRRYNKPPKHYEEGYPKAKELLEALDKLTPDQLKDRKGEFVEWYEKVFEQKLDDATRARVEPKAFRKPLERFRDFYDRTYTEAFKDIRPDVFHRILLTIIGKNGGALVFDTSANEQVWNYPAYAYKTRLTHKEDFTDKDGNARKRYTVETSVRFATDGVDESVLGVKSFENHYGYELVTDTDGRPVDGEWTGPSVDQHPDFAWVPLNNPYGPDDEENYKLEYRRLKGILPLFNTAKDKERIVLKLQLPDGTRFRSDERRPKGEVRTWSNPVKVLTGQDLILDLAKEGGLRSDWTARYYAQEMESHWGGAATVRRDAPVLLDRNTWFGGYDSDVRFAEPGRKMVVAKLASRNGRLLAWDEITVLVETAPANAPAPAAPATPAATTSAP